MEDSYTILDNLDETTQICYDSELEQEFEPLEKGTIPVEVVKGNMVCSDMRLICAFGSDQVYDCLSKPFINRMVGKQWKIEFPSY